MASDYDLYFTIAEEIPYIQYLAKAVKVFDQIYNFGRESEEERAIRLLEEQVAIMRSELEEINSRLNALTDRVTQTENAARMRQILEHRLEIEGMAFRLGRTPDVDDLAEIANSAALRLGAMLDDADLWLWSDIRRRLSPMGLEVHELAAPDFKVIPLPVFSAAVAVFALASAQHISKEPASRPAYAEKFARFHRAVTVRKDWVDLQSAPESLPEQVRSRITVMPLAATKYVTAGQCVYNLTCVNQIDRTRSAVREVAILSAPDASPSTLCTARPDLGKIDEMVIEDDYGPIKLLATLEKILDGLIKWGTLTEPPAMQFPNVTYHRLYLYVVEPTGQLRRFDCKLGTSLTEEVGWESSGAEIGTGWHGFRTVLAGHWDVLYAIQSDDSILWYRHDGTINNSSNWSTPKVVGQRPRILGLYDEQYIAGSYGTMYQSAKTNFGGGPGPTDSLRVRTQLSLRRHNGVEHGGGEFTEPIMLSADWGAYENVFGGGNGVIYGIDATGRLFWHKHTDSGDNRQAIEGPHQIGTGWNSFERVFSTGHGFIFGIYKNGSMLAYRLNNWRQGPVNGGPANWSGPAPVNGTQWNSYATLVPVIDDQPTGGVH